MVCIVHYLLMYHTDSKFKSLPFQALLNTWRTPGLGTMVDAECHDTVSLPNLVSQISKEFCSQFQSGVMKMARRTVLDEIVSCIILECLDWKKIEKNYEVEQLHQSVKTCSSNGKRRKRTRRNKSKKLPGVLVMTMTNETEDRRVVLREKAVLLLKTVPIRVFLRKNGKDLSLSPSRSRER